MYTIGIDTDKSGLFEITDEVKKAVAKGGVKNGLAALWVPHSTAGITVISRMDELGFLDIVDEVNRLVPTRIDFKHQFDTPTDASGHIKSAIVGVSLTCIVEDGQLVIGSSQGIYFFEFDGPRSRKYHIEVLGK